MSGGGWKRTPFRPRTGNRDYFGTHTHTARLKTDGKLTLEVLLSRHGEPERTHRDHVSGYKPCFNCESYIDNLPTETCESHLISRP